jgi:cbb3-type cytochrome oxidase subunit 1
MKNLPYYFIGVATLFALAGMAYGISMAVTTDFTLAPAHAHNNLLGWVSMAIFGLYYRAVPGAITRLAVVHFWVALVANLVFPVGIGLALLNRGEVLASVGGVLEIISMLIFAIIVWSNRRAIMA